MGPGGRRGAYNRWGVADSLGRADGLAIRVISSGDALLLGRLSDSLRPAWPLSGSPTPYLLTQASSPALVVPLSLLLHWFRIDVR